MHMQRTMQSGVRNASTQGMRIMLPSKQEHHATKAAVVCNNSVTLSLNVQVWPKRDEVVNICNLPAKYLPLFESEYCESLA